MLQTSARLLALPPLLLDDAEAVAVAVGLRTAASGQVAGIEETSVRALAKLEQVLPNRLRRRVRALGEATSAFNIEGPRYGGSGVMKATCGERPALACSVAMRRPG